MRHALPTALAAVALTLSLAACGGADTTDAAASATPGSSTGSPTAASSDTPAPTETSSAAATSSTATPAAITWSTTKKAGKKGTNYSETLELPTLENASPEATKAFDRAVASAITQSRSEVHGSDSDECHIECSLTSEKLSSAVYEQRYASVLMGLHPAGDGVAPRGTPFGLTVDLETGKTVPYGTFVSAHAAAVDAAAQAALNSDGATPHRRRLRA